MSKNKKSEKTVFDQGRMVRELARERVGIVPSSKPFKEHRKKDETESNNDAMMDDWLEDDFYMRIDNP